MKTRPLSKNQVKEIIASSSFEKTDLTTYFDCPLPNYEEFPHTDKGWLGIAKCVLQEDSPYKKTIRVARHCKEKESHWKNINNIEINQDWLFTGPKNRSNKLDRKKSKDESHIAKTDDLFLRKRK
mmetsp:Transcript_21957/g.19509  ORF Transcript_21957/g.19509 Transcript_21957/m.19509 type:complete len:125 (-) Transcript_21957:379-753(-)